MPKPSKQEGNAGGRAASGSGSGSGNSSVILFLLLLLSSVVTGIVEPKVRYTTSDGIEFLRQNIKKAGMVETKTGLQYKIVTKTSNPNALSPNLTTPVHVNYIGRNIKGETFDSSASRRGTPTIMLPSNLIPGWQEALMMMKEGDQWQITVPAELGYRDRKLGAKIPAGAVLVFDLELVKVITEQEVINPFGFITSLQELLGSILSLPPPLWIVIAYMLGAWGVRAWYRLRNPEKPKVLKELKQVADRDDNPRVFFDVRIGSSGTNASAPSTATADPTTTSAALPVQRIEMELFRALCPRTVENFRCLCTGEKGMAQRSWYEYILCRSTRLHLKGSKFHRIIPKFMAQGGDIEHHDGDGGRCIYGTSFPDEWEHGYLSHTTAGLLSMANCGRNTNSSQFFITFAEARHLDGKHVVFGRVVKGLDVVTAIEAAAAAKGGRPRVPVVIVDCGELPASTLATSAAAQSAAESSEAKKER